MPLVLSRFTVTRRSWIEMSPSSELLCESIAIPSGPTDGGGVPLIATSTVPMHRLPSDA